MISTLASLVDRFADEKDLFETVLQGIKDDVNGPQVDLRADLIAHLGERAMVIIDTVEPITKSERLMLAVELIDPAAVAKTIDKAMEKDPDARKREHKGQVIWEITNEADPSSPSKKSRSMGQASALAMKWPRR